MNEHKVSVVTSCSGRFWVYDQAKILNEMGMLSSIIHDYPRFYTRKWGIPDNKSRPLILNGIVGRLLRNLPRSISKDTKSRLVKFHHDWFSNRLANQLHTDTELFIGLSSFCKEAILKCNKFNIPSAVDHGSLHQAYEKQLLLEESDFLNIDLTEDIPASWIISKEEDEFLYADKIMLLSNAAKKSFLARGYPEDKLLVNPCGVDTGNFYKTDIVKDKFTIIFVAGKSPRKGLHYLLRAFNELDLDESELLIVGSKPSNKYYEKLLKKQYTDKIKDVGVVAYDELKHLYSRSSVFVLPSIADGFGLVVTQAMACGCVPIVTDNVGAADVIEDEVTGFKIPIRNIDALKNKIKYLYDNPIQLKNMSNNAISSINSNWSWSDYGQRLNKIVNIIRDSRNK